MTSIYFFHQNRLNERQMKLEGSEEINGDIYCALNYIKLLRICETLLSQLKSHGLRWNNATVSPLVLGLFGFFFFAFFAEVWYFYSQCYHVTQINKSFRKNTYL